MTSIPSQREFWEDAMCLYQRIYVSSNDSQNSHLVDYATVCSDWSAGTWTYNFMTSPYTKVDVEAVYIPSFTATGYAVFYMPNGNIKPYLPSLE